MLNVLLESRSNRQRRSGGALLSVAVHMGIIAAVVVGTVTATPAPKFEKPKAVIIVQPIIKHARIVSEHEVSRASRTPAPLSDIVIRHIDIPRIVPRGIPPVEVAQGSPSDVVVLGGAPSPGGLAGAVGNVFDSGNGGSNEWNVNEVLMHLVTSAKPRYPESLRSAGIDGRVLVEFAVDTTGRVDLATIKVLGSTHDLFTRAVKDALSAMRFRPAEVGGKHVAALAQMPFEFHVR